MNALDARVLLVDDDPSACRLLAEALGRERYGVVTATSVAEATARLDTETFDAVLTDLRMPNASGLDLLREVRRRQPDAIVFVLTAFGDAEATAQAIRAGAYDFLSKPYDLDALRTALATALERRRLARRRRAEAIPTITDDDAPSIAGHSPQIIEVVKTLARAAPTDATVLLLGESGTGKELAARTIHRYSRRHRGPFVVVNCGALPETLLESELFGHVKGAFTGAHAPRPGLFREANGGTLFLDEIGDVSPALQARLLRALQEREIVPVGAETPVKIDVRVVAATHRNLEAMVRDGRFREDLFYRLNVVSLALPPLRERRQDIPVLIDDFLRNLARHQGRGPIAVDPKAQTLLFRHDWPGNVRQLQNVLERALVLAEQDVIGPEHLPAEIRGGGTPASAGLPSSGAKALASLAELEREHVLRVLDTSAGDREAAARTLGISRRTLTRMLQRWGLHHPDTLSHGDKVSDPNARPL